MGRRLFCALVVCAITGSARGADQVVTDIGDEGAPNQLRAKITECQNSGGGIITFATQGTIVLTGGALPSISSNVTIDGGGTITISGNDATRIFNVLTTAGATLTLRNLTITKGYSSSGDGGAISSRGTVNIENCRFMENRTATSWSGGAIVTYGPLNVRNSEFGANKAGGGGAIYPRHGATASIVDCNFHDNLALAAGSGSLGGAILVWDGPVVTIERSSFTNNNAGYSGGAIHVLANSTLTATGSTFTGNSTSNSTTTGVGGGAIYNAGTLNLADSRLAANSAPVPSFSAGGGGGIRNQGGTVNLTRVTLIDNTTSNEGGGIRNVGSLTLVDCTIATNRGQWGGGLWSASANATITGCTFNGNQGGTGGGIYNWINSTNTISNSTFSGNTASSGGGIYNFNGVVTITNATFSGNSANTGSGVGQGSNEVAKTMTLRNTLFADSAMGTNCSDNSSFEAGTIKSGDGNLSDDDSCSRFFKQPRDRNGAQHDPLLRPLADNGGATLTHLPSIEPKSPAIDNGVQGGAPTIDQRGIQRPQGAGFDVGAVEVAPSDTATPTPTPEPTVTPTPTATPVPNRFANISTRLRVETGDNVLIGGFIVTGSMQKKIIVRALGPSLPLEDRLANPLLELYDANAQLIDSNDNWEDAPNRQEIIDSTIPPQNALEAAILRNVDPGAYTAVVRDAADGQGGGLVEVYDLGDNQDSKLANIATRGRVLTGDNVMIGGLIVTGSSPQKVILRAIGPSLGIAGQLEDPLLELFDGDGNPIASNNNWKETQQAEIEATTIPPSNELESAIVTFLAPGAYTAIVRGVDETTGIALVEAYAL